MKENEIYLPEEIYSHHLSVIGKIRFSRREIDVISCLLKGRATKRTAHFLSISPKTVATHIRNIMLKLETNSREGIIDFIERSSKNAIFQKYYNSLIISLRFENTLKQLSKTIQFENCTCSLVIRKNQKNDNFFISLLETHLKIVGVSVFLDERNEKGENISINHQKDVPATHSIYVVDSLNEQASHFAQNFNLQSSDIVIFFGNSLFEVDPKSKSLSLCEQGNYHFLFLELLKTIFPNINFKYQIKNFEEDFSKTEPFVLQRDNNVDFGQSPTSQPHSLKRNNKNNFFWKICFVCTIFLSICVLFYYKNSCYINNVNTIRSDLILPNEKVLLERPILLTQLENKLRTSQVVALVGIGGSGKTTLARQYAQQQNASIVWEINAETKESLNTSFEKLGSAFAKTEKDTQALREIQEIKYIPKRDEALIQFVKAHLRDIPNWFLIFDNVEKFTDIQHYFPQDAGTWGAGKIILTTRDSNIENNPHVNQVVFIGELNPRQKLALFTKIMGQGAHKASTIDRCEDAKKFLANIPPFPLDISTAAYYLKATQISYNNYLENLQTYDQDFANLEENLLKEAGSYIKTRYGIITLSIEHLIKNHKDFGDLLFFISLLDSQNIPRDLLNVYKSNTIVDNFIYHLKKYSLITTDSSIESSLPAFSLHRSTQAIALTYLTKTFNLQKNNKYLESISYSLDSYANDLIDREDFAKMKFFISHCEKFLSHTTLLTDNVSSSMECTLGCIYYYLCDYIKSSEILKKNLNNLAKGDNKKYTEIARALAHLGSAYKELGNYKDAKDLLEQSLLIYESHYPKNHVGISRTLTYLGLVYRELGNHRKARDLLEKSLKIHKKQPTKHAGISRTLAYLGIVYESLGDYEKSKNFFEQSFVVHKKHLPENHFRIGWISVYLGSIHRNLGNYKKAQDLLKQSLLIYENHFPKKHIGIGWILIFLGSVHMDFGNYKDAKNLFEESFLIYKNYFPKNNAELAWASVHLGNAYRALGNYAKARRLLEESLEIYKQHFSKESTELAWILAHLGNVYKDLEDYAKAKNLLEKSLVNYETHYGKNHIEVARLLRDLGEVYFLEDNFIISENLINKALVIFRQNKHVESYTCLESLAKFYLKKSLRAVNKKAEIQFKIQAINFLRQALTTMKPHLPTNSPHILRIQSKLKTISPPLGG